jgi:hypothetical protein
MANCKSSAWRIGADGFAHSAHLKRLPSQTWKTFLRNHLSEIVAIDFFAVPTIRLRVLFVFLIMEHRPRRVLHFCVTEHPTPERTGQSKPSPSAMPHGIYLAIAIPSTGPSFAIASTRSR